MTTTFVGAPLPQATQRTRRRRIIACTTSPPEKYDLAPGEIPVRFINVPSGPDVVAAAAVGDPLLKVGDSVGVHIPRACQSGLCGSCTCDVLDTSTEDGRQTVRACQTGAIIPDGGQELIVDVARMKSFKRKDPMARFENLDTEYVAGAAPKPSKKPGSWLETVACEACTGTGDIECYACDGIGVDSGFPCSLCVGTGTLRCADCQGNGTVQRNR